jgi:flagellar hook-associated protein 3 FlgL
VQIANTTQQMATGQRILSPADDPAGAARAAELTQSESANTQYSTNRTAAVNTLSLSQGVLESVTSLLQDLQTTALTAGNGTLSDVSRKALATDVQGRLQDLLGLANSTDGAGSYLFSGAQGNVKPFAEVAAGVVYQGDDVQRKLQVSTSRQISSTDSGADIFVRIRNGNGTFKTSQNVTNTGSGVISQGGVTNQALATGDNYQVAFTVAPPTTFTVNDLTTGLPVAGMSNVPYVSGQSISFEGIQFEIKGTPANGDTFTVAPSNNQSIFDTLTKLVATLNSPLPTGNATAAAQYTQGLNEAFASLNQDLSAVLGVRATMGSRLNELDALQSAGDQVGLQLKSTLSKIQDTDYTKAMTDLTQQKLILQAAQQSFAQISKLSLFNYM